jgi:hypothetical protein
MTSTINRNNFKTDIGKELYDLLVQIMPREDYIYFVLSLAKGDENRKKVIDFIKNTSQDWYDVVQFVDNNW